MQIFIERAKGKKDRYVNLSPVLLDILNYIKQYLPRPKEYLFKSEQTLTAYPARTVQQNNWKIPACQQTETGKHCKPFGRFNEERGNRMVNGLS